MGNEVHVSIWVVGLACLGLTAVTGCETGMRRGQSATVQFGIVRSAEQITLDSAAAQGALIGGMLGVATGGRRDSTAGNAIRGAAVGGVATAAAEGNRKGTAYTVDLLDGSATRIVTDQHEIRTGDCVAVERTGTTANIRRKSPAYCDRANTRAVQTVESATRSQAARCESAKEELEKANSDEAVDLATRKIELLCDD